MPKIKIDQLIRSARRTLSLEIASDARLIVRAPQKIKLEAIENFISKKRSWIQSKQQWIQKKCAEIRPKQFIAEEKFLYLGQEYELSFFISQSEFPTARQSLIEWYKKQAHSIIPERVKKYAEIAGAKYCDIKISNATKRWGSCGPYGRLRFNWRLVMAPLQVVDYVVAHEVAHLQEKNHGRRFWKKVQSLQPSYKEEILWLKENHPSLNL